VERPRCRREATDRAARPLRAVDGDDLTVVFDRQPQRVSAGVHGAISVAFAARSRRNVADRDIAEIVAQDEDPSSLTVVTSDRALADRVRQRGARVMSSGSFRRNVDEVQTGFSP
jgi:predicted RNA-binding protein with PIN domain